jgi:glycine/D-amino acid oxidase-like deaminating enzyme
VAPVRAAVVGGGVYGCTIAADLARAGHRVDLYERHLDLVRGASRATQGRLHAGYHYPRSLPTALAARADAARFAARFPRAVDRSHTHCYAVAGEGSLTGADAYLAFCGRLGGGHAVAEEPLLRGVEVAVRVPEALVSASALRELLRAALKTARVPVHFGAAVDPGALGHSLVVVAAYGAGWPEPLRWEVCETALVRLGAAYARRSFVVLDGAFVSLDPVPGSRLHLLYDVAHSVHAANVGLAPEVPGHLAHLLDRGPVVTPHTRVGAMLATARRFLPGLGDPAYKGSSFTVRAVLPGVEETDERPTLLRRDGRVVHVLAGKIDGAPAAAERVVAMAGELVPA